MVRKKSLPVTKRGVTPTCSAQYRAKSNLTHPVRPCLGHVCQPQPTHGEGVTAQVTAHHATRVVGRVAAGEIGNRVRARILRTERVRAPTNRPVAATRTRRIGARRENIDEERIAEIVVAAILPEEPDRVELKRLWVLPLVRPLQVLLVRPLQVLHIHRHDGERRSVKKAVARKPRHVVRVGERCGKTRFLSRRAVHARHELRPRWPGRQGPHNECRNCKTTNRHSYELRCPGNHSARTQRRAPTEAIGRSRSEPARRQNNVSAAHAPAR